MSSASIAHIIIALILAGCSMQSAPELPSTGTTIPSDTPLPTEPFTPEPTFTPSATPIVILDPDPVQIQFQASDGQELSGLYYPASENPAPIIVLVHGMEGDHSEWEQIAKWLQNRDQLVKEPDYNDSWKSSDWFPENPNQEPLGVLTFTLRECASECQAFLPSEWLLDIEAAMKTAAHLQGVDRGQVLTAGASIGADGAIYGCDWLNQAGEGSCYGSFSLSPASLLTIPYQELVESLIKSKPPRTVYCLYALRDDASVETCSGLPGITGIDYGYIEAHGLELIQSGQLHNPLELLLEFIKVSLTGK